MRQSIGRSQIGVNGKLNTTPRSPSRMGPPALHSGMSYVGKAVSDALNWDTETLLAFEEWLRPVFGHHGKPIADSGVTKAKDVATRKAISDAADYAVEVSALCLGKATASIATSSRIAA